MVNNLSQINNCRKKLTDIEIKKELDYSREMRRLTRILQQIFEYGYNDNSPKWYWLAVRDLFLNMNYILKFIPIFDDFGSYVGETQECNIDGVIELDDLNVYSVDMPIISICWKLLDKFYDRLYDRNLFFVRLGLLVEFDRIAYKYYNDFAK